MNNAYIPLEMTLEIPPRTYQISPPTSYRIPFKIEDCVTIPVP